MSNHLIDISVLRQNREYALLYAGQFITFIGAVITTVAIPYQTYDLTKSTAIVGLLSLSQLIPLLFTALLGGIYADRYNRRKIVMLSEIALTIGCVILTLNANLEHPSLWVIFITSSIMSGITGMHRPSIESMTQQLVPAKHYKAVGALGSFKFSFCLIVGPAIAGLLIAHFSLVAAYIADIITFATSLICLLCMQKTPTPKCKQHPPILTSLKEGISYAYQRKELLGSYYVDFIAMLCAQPTILFPAIAENLGGPKVLGLLYSSEAVGALLVSFFSGWTSNVKSDTKAITISAALYGVAVIGFGMAHNLYLALGFLAIGGAFDAISGIFRVSLWNSSIPTDKRGRLAGIEMLSYLSGPRLGGTRAGFFAEFMGLPGAIISGGALCIFGVWLCAKSMPKFWNYNAEQKTK